jgi:prefoldin subunit 2
MFRSHRHTQVGEVLVERTVGEALPAVTKNRDNLKARVAQLKTQFETQKKELAEFQEKHGIRVRPGQRRPGSLVGLPAAS